MADKNISPYGGLAGALLPRSVKAGEQRFTFRPPTVMEAISIQDVLPGALRGDAGDLQALWDVLESWLPAAVRAHLNSLDPAGFAKALRALLDEGGQLAGAPKAKKKTAEQVQKPVPPFEVALADVSHVYGAEPWTVLSTWPWPLFLRLARAARTVSARALLRWSEIATLPHTGKYAKQGFERLEARADGDDLVDPDAPIPGAPMEQILEDRKRLRRMLGGAGGHRFN